MLNATKGVISGIRQAWTDYMSDVLNIALTQMFFVVASNDILWRGMYLY